MTGKVSLWSPESWIFSVWQHFAKNDQIENRHYTLYKWRDILKFIKSRIISCIMILSYYCEDWTFSDYSIVMLAKRTLVNTKQSFWFWSWRLSVCFGGFVRTRGNVSRSFNTEIKCDASTVGGSSMPSVSMVPSRLKRQVVETEKSVLV